MTREHNSLEISNEDNSPEMTNEDIIFEYYETSITNISKDLLDFLNFLIDKKRPQFNQLADKNRLKFSSLMELLYNDSQKFPFFLNETEIDEILTRLK